jgi:hypothetical protein
MFTFRLLLGIETGLRKDISKIQSTKIHVYIQILTYSILEQHVVVLKDVLLMAIFGSLDSHHQVVD